MSRFVSALLVTAAVMAAPAVAQADRRSFTRTYEYMTMPQGDLELEFYNTQSLSTFDDDSPRSFKMQVEVEYGITDRWDVSLYQVFSQKSNPTDPTQSTAFNYSETKVRTRYRFAERGELPIDVLAYFEVKKPFAEEGIVLEPKLILARDFGAVTVAVNPYLEMAVLGEEFEWEPKWAAGATYELQPSFRLGAETFGALDLGDDETEVKAWAGPSLSWAPSPKLWTAVNAAFGLTESSDDFTVQLIVGLGI